MRVILFGATGMVGQGVLRECLLDPDVEQVLAIGRTRLETEDPKLDQIVKRDLFDYSDIEDRLLGFGACLFCLGVSAFGLSEAEYRRITLDLTLAAAQTLARIDPEMTFVYVSGAGTDSSAKGRVMWARIKGETENHLLELPFDRAYMFRPAFIQPLHGIKTKTKLYRVFYAITTPLHPLWKRLFPSWVTTTEEVGRAMIHVARSGHESPIIENRTINEIATQSRVPSP